MRRYWLPIASFICIIPVIFNLLKPGFFVSDDGEWMLIRFTSFYQEIVNGQFPVRYLNRLNNGYGYPVATFLYPGFMYLATPLKLVGFSFIWSIKAILIGSVIGAFVGAFLWLSTRFSKYAAFIGALFYIYHPYFLWDIYKRGSVGEVLALGILPFVLYLLEKKQYFGASLMLGLIIISHNTLALFFFPFTLLYLFFVQYVSKTPLHKTIKSICIVAVVSLGASAFFWMPALFELSYTAFSRTSISSWSGYFVSNLILVGFIHMAILAVFALALLFRKVKFDPFMTFIAAVAFGSLFLSTYFSYPVWDNLSLGKYVQFPFRFLSLVIPTVSFLISYIYSQSKKIPLIIYYSVILLTIAAGLPMLSPVSYTNLPSEYYRTNEATTTVKDEYMPLWVTNIPQKRAESTIVRIDEQTVQINTIYWPGHEVQVNNSPRPINYVSGGGLIRVHSVSDRDKIDLLLKETPLRFFSDVISFVSVIISLVFSRKQYA